MKNTELFQQQALIKDQIILIIDLFDKWIDYVSTVARFDNTLFNDFYLKKCAMINFQENIINEFKDSKWNDIEYVKKKLKNLKKTEQDYRIYCEEETAQSYKDYIEQITRCEYRD